MFLSSTIHLETILCDLQKKLSFKIRPKIRLICLLKNGWKCRKLGLVLFIPTDHGGGVSHIMHIIPWDGDYGSLNFKVMTANKWLLGKLSWNNINCLKLLLFSGDLLLENVKFKLHLMEVIFKIWLKVLLGKYNYLWEIANGIQLKTWVLPDGKCGDIILSKKDICSKCLHSPKKSEF